MIPKSRVKGAASAGMLSAMFIFVGLILYARYYAFIPAVEQPLPQSAVALQTNPDAESSASDAGGSPDVPAGNIAPVAAKSSVDQSAPPGMLVEQTKPTQAVAEPLIAAVEPASLDDADATSASVIPLLADPTSAADTIAAVKPELPIQPAIATYHGQWSYPVSGDAAHWRAAQLHGANGDWRQAQGQNGNLGGRYHQRGRAQSNADGEFNFAMKFRGRSRFDADSDIDGDWAGAHDARALNAHYMDTAYQPRFGYYGYR